MAPAVMRLLLALLALLLPVVHGLASTDSPSDADQAQSGYLPNHNMDPAIISSSQFGQLWKITFRQNELFYAKPLVYTPSSTGVQIVFLASAQNFIRTLNAKDGSILNERQVQTPFLQSDIGCTDIPNFIGIIGTPIIDPTSDTAYFFAKTYIPNFRAAGSTGTINGVYYFYGVDVNTLEDKPGFPILVDGSFADNDPRKYFMGGTILQRPALTQIGDFVYGAFGGHCDLFNYTGLVVGIDVKQKKIVTSFAMEAGPLVPQTNVFDQNGGGGQAGIWMSGMAMATDGDRLFLVTGNGDGRQNNGIPATGRSGCQTLGEAVVNMAVDSSTGALSVTDYFQPYDYINMDGGDEDFGSGGICLLDPTVFNGTGVSRIGVTAGKNGKVYVVNADNLGGYKLGPAQQDGVLQVIETDLAVFGGSGSYPLEGGYFYLTPVGNPTFVYKLGHDESGQPIFSRVGQTHETSAGRVGVGIPTITSLNNQPGTAVLWMADPDAGLRAWHAVPGADGFLEAINLPQINGMNKFQRPSFGDGRLYVTDSQSSIYCLGSPVALPLNCTSPINFGNVALGSFKTLTVNCTANIPITSVAGATTGSGFFVVRNSSLPKGPLAQGESFSFPVTWDLSNATVADAGNASFGSVTPGVKSTALTLQTANDIPNFSTLFPISLTGTEVSQKPFLSLTPVEVDFGGIVLTGNTSNVSTPTIASTFAIGNVGLSPMNITGYGWTTDEIDDDPNYTNVTADKSGAAVLGFGFTSTNVPAVGTIVSAGQSLAVPVTFTPLNGTGAYSSFFTVWTTGGSALTLLSGSASTAPIAQYSISNGEGGWLPHSNVNMEFGTLMPGNTSTRTIQICNIGGSVLTITKSKPPIQPQLAATAPGIDLHESQKVPVNTCATGSVIFEPAVIPPNEPDQFITDLWTINTDDVTSFVHEINITGTIHDRQLGPLFANGSSRYRYLGCYQDGTNGRVLPQQFVFPTNNTNGLCQQTCLDNGFTFAGTEFMQECWCGNVVPSGSFFHAESENKCTYSCTGDATQACGGDGTFVSIYYDTVNFTPTNDTFTPGPSTTTSAAPTQTIDVPGNQNFTLLGCYQEPTNARALTNLVVAEDDMTVELCLSRCSAFKFAGIEFARECWCDNSLNSGATKTTLSSCTMACMGNLGEFCGGPNLLNLYMNNNTVAATPTPARSR